MTEVNNSKSNEELSDLVVLHENQYVVVNGAISRVQSTNVSNYYDIEKVDAEDISVDLSDDYDLLQILLKAANDSELDISNLIIKWLKDYPTISKNLAEAQNLANEKDKELNADAEQIQTLESKNQQLEKELADLKAKPSEPATKPDDQSKPGTSNTINTAVSSDQPANKD